MKNACDMSRTRPVGQASRLWPLSHRRRPLRSRLSSPFPWAGERVPISPVGGELSAADSVPVETPTPAAVLRMSAKQGKLKAAMHGLAEEMRSASNAVVNAVERRTAIDLDRDGDVGVAGSSRKSEPAGQWMEKATGTPAFYAPEMCVKGGAPGPLGFTQKHNPGPSSTLRKQTLLTPVLLAPGYLGKPADIWAAGVTLCQLTGSNPFAAPDLPETFRRIQTEEPTLPGHASPELLALLRREPLAAAATAAPESAAAEA